MSGKPSLAGPELIQFLSRPIEPVPTGLRPVLPDIPGIRCVLFDVYGTLVASTGQEPEISNPSYREATLRSLLEDFDIPAPGNVPSLTGQLDTMIAREHEKAHRRGTAFPEIEIRSLWSELLQSPRSANLERLAIAYECLTNPVWPMPGATTLIKLLQAQGLVLGIVSNAQFYTPLLFPALFGGSLSSLGFAEELCLFSYEFRSAKPGLTLYETMRDLLSDHGIAVHEALYLGNDTFKDIQPAAEVGFRTVLFAGDQRSLQLPEGHTTLHQPEAVVTELTQITALLSHS